MYMGILTQVFFDYDGTVTRRALGRFPYTRTTLLSAALFTLGLFFSAFLLVHYVRVGYVLSPNDAVAHLGVTGLLLMIAGFSTFTFTLLLHAMQGRVVATKGAIGDGGQLHG
jgi:hypothetical protein